MKSRQHSLHADENRISLQRLEDC